MPNRREFLRSGAAVSAIAANGMISRSADAFAPSRAIEFGRALFDGRYAEGRRFAAVLGAQGVPTRALDDGDITRFWYDELEALWRRPPVALVGFTQFGPMFVVERLAAERGMRSVLRIEHCRQTDGALAHRFTGPRETLALAAELGPLHSDWPGLMAALACSVGTDESPHCSAELATPGPVPSLAPSVVPAAPFVHYYTPLADQQGYAAALEGSLYSWVVAPRASATR